MRRDTRCSRCAKTLLAGQASVRVERAYVCLGCWDAVRADPNRPPAELLRDFGIARSGVAVNRAPSTGGGRPRRPSAPRVAAKPLDGELIVGGELDRRAEGSAARVLHARAIPGAGLDLDHVFVGRSGVTAIDVKNFNFSVEIEQLVGWASDSAPPNLLINGENRRDLIDAAVALREALVPIAATAISNVDVPVNAALCFVDVNGVDRTPTRDIRAVRVDTPEKIADHVQRRGPLLDDEIELVAAFLEEAVPRR
ncbi:MAG: nuclease-related domain-containing protein [Solirubrobacterales bacterium]